MLPEHLKTPQFLHILYANRDKIHASQEYRTRQEHSMLTEDKVYNLVYAITENKELADKAKSYFILEETKRERIQ